MKLISLIAFTLTTLAGFAHERASDNPITAAAIDRILNSSGSSGPTTAGLSSPSTWSGARPDGHAPIGVMGDHTHRTGKWMASYRYMFMKMQENYDGTSSISDASVFADPRFMVVPTDMDMEMHMFGLMYAPTDRLTLMGMFNYVELSMNHLTGMGTTFKTESSGIGDSSLTALYRFWDGPRQQAHFGLGVLLPTAEVDEKDFIPPAGASVRLPYPMQLGAGSWGLAPSLTYLGQSDHWSWGAQISGKFYLDDNKEGYRLGNRGEVTIWGARRLNDWASASVRLAGSTWDNIHGNDDNLLPLPVPTVNPKLRGGSRLDAAFGLNLQVPDTGARVAVEFGLPFWHDVDGPQLVTDWWAMIGAQYAF